MGHDTKSKFDDETNRAIDKILRIAKDNMKKEIVALKQHNKAVKKKAIPATVKRLVWHKYIGEDKGKAKCVCCNTTDITQLSFHCGHVVPEAHGGEIIVDNLRPVCQNCNSSMGTMNMNDFKQTYKF
jgi:5-methylcytosine-specific restriction endonuclease McrA